MMHWLFQGHGPGTALALFLVGLVTATVNSIAGGGSTLSLPVMILLGVPPVFANGTNRVGILAGNFSSVADLRKHGYLDMAMYRRLLPATVIGALLGVVFAIWIDDKMFTTFLAVVMIMVAILSRLGTDPLGPPPVAPPAQTSWRAHLIFGVLGLYGSFMQVGVGFLQIFALRRYTGYDLVRVNALKNSLTSSFLLISSIGFLFAGRIVWGLALCMSLGALIGGKLGSKLQRRKGTAFIQGFVSWAGIALAAKLLWDVWF